MCRQEKSFDRLSSISLREASWTALRVRVLCQMQHVPGAASPRVRVVCVQLNEELCAFAFVSVVSMCVYLLDRTQYTVCSRAAVQL